MQNNDTEINILTTEGYFKRFYEICQTAKTYKEAWELLENEMFEKYQITKYSSYESFRRNKTAFHKKK